MLRVNKVDEWLRREPARPDLSTQGDCVIIRAAHADLGLTSGVTSRSAGAQGLRMNLVMVPPGSRGMPHFHPDHETAIYTVSGQTELWHGEGLVKRTVVRAGDFMYIPPGIPHLPVNRGDVMAVAVVARTDPAETDNRVVVELPRHLASLLCLPVAVQDLLETRVGLPRGWAAVPAGVAAGTAAISWMRLPCLRIT